MSVFYRNPERGTMPYSGRGSIGTLPPDYLGGSIGVPTNQSVPRPRMGDNRSGTYWAGTPFLEGGGSIGTPYVRQPGGGYRNYADLVKEAAQSGPPDVRMVDGGYRNYADSIAREYAQSPYGGGGIPAQQQNWMGLLAELYNLRSPR